MAQSHATRHDDLVNLAKDWRAQTRSMALRSKELKALDDALKQYARLGNLGAVETAFDAWKFKVGAGGKRWQDSHRNAGSRGFEALAAILGRSGDVDSAFGTSGVVSADHVNARQGILYLFGNMEVDTSVAAVILEGGLNILGGALSFAGADLGKGGGLGIGAAGTAATNIGTARVMLDQVASIAMNTDAMPVHAPNTGATGGAATLDAAQLRAAHATLKERLMTWFHNFLNNLKVELMDKFGIVDMAVGSVHNLIKVLVGALAAQAAPIVGGSMQMVTGLTQTIDRGMTNFKTWKAGLNVQLADGHPGTVVNAITTAMKASLFEGLYKMLKGAASIGLAAVAGISAIVDLVVAALEMIVKVVWRLVECHRMNSFCQQAATHWRQAKGMEFASKPFAFNSWFRKTTLFAPALPILTLNSGICGSKMVFLQMFADNQDAESVITQGQFDTGVGYIDGHLRPWGANYLKSCAFGFKSGSEQVLAAIERAKSHSYAVKEHAAWAGFKKAVGA